MRDTLIIAGFLLALIAAAALLAPFAVPPRRFAPWTKLVAEGTAATREAVIVILAGVLIAIVVVSLLVLFLP